MKNSIFNSPRIFYFSSPSRSRYNDGGSNNRESTGLTFGQLGITRPRRLFSCSTISLSFAET